MRTRYFTAAFTGRLSVVEDIRLAPAMLRVEKGHEYRVEIHDDGKGKLVDMTVLLQEEQAKAALADAVSNVTVPEADGERVA